MSLILTVFQLEENIDRMIFNTSYITEDSQLVYLSISETPYLSQENQDGTHII